MNLLKKCSFLKSLHWHTASQSGKPLEPASHDIPANNALLGWKANLTWDTPSEGVMGVTKNTKTFGFGRIVDSSWARKQRSCLSSQPLFSNHEMSTYHVGSDSYHTIAVDIAGTWHSDGAGNSCFQFSQEVHTR